MKKQNKSIDVFLIVATLCVLQIAIAGGMHYLYRQNQEMKYKHEAILDKVHELQNRQLSRQDIANIVKYSQFEDQCKKKGGNIFIKNVPAVIYAMPVDEHVIEYMVCEVSTSKVYKYEDLIK